MRREIYSGLLELNGVQHRKTLIAASNYCATLIQLERFKEAKALLRRMLPVARRVLGESDNLSLKMRWHYALALYKDDVATLDDIREAVTTLESVAKSWKQVFGISHPETPRVQGALNQARVALALVGAAASSGAA